MFAKARTIAYFDLLVFHLHIRFSLEYFVNVRSTVLTKILYREKDRGFFIVTYPENVS